MLEKAKKGKPKWPNSLCIQCILNMYSIVKSGQKKVKSGQKLSSEKARMTEKSIPRTARATLAVKKHMKLLRKVWLIIKCGST